MVICVNLLTPIRWLLIHILTTKIFALCVADTNRAYNRLCQTQYSHATNSDGLSTAPKKRSENTITEV